MENSVHYFKHSDVLYSKHQHKNRQSQFLDKLTRYVSPMMQRAGSMLKVITPCSYILYS